MSGFLEQWADEKLVSPVVENVSKYSIAGEHFPSVRAPVEVGIESRKMHRPPTLPGEPDVVVPAHTAGSFASPNRDFPDPHAAEAFKAITDLLVVSYERYRRVRRIPASAPETVNKELALTSSPSVHGHGSQP
jgi:hypothetical protein